MNSNSDRSQGDWRATPEYASAQAQRERGEWAQALTHLQELQTRYGTDKDLENLIADTQLRLEAARGRPLRGRRFKRLGRRAVFFGLLLAVLISLALAAASLYRNMITPSLAGLRAEQAQNALAEQAQSALTAGDHAQALELYDQLAAENPEHPALAEGRAKAQQTVELEQTYQLAEEQLAAGQLDEARATLLAIQQTAPDYKQVDLLLSQIERQLHVASLGRDAAASQAAGDWEGMITALEEARTLTQGDERKRIEADLYTAFMERAAQLTAASDGGIGDLNNAIQAYSKALSLQPGATEATSQRNWLRQYVAGSEAVTAGRWDAAIAQFEPLYTAKPDFLDGRAAELLYTAYVRSSDALLSQDEVARAWERFHRATQIAGVDTSSARAMAASLSLRLTPTPTPSPTPTPTIAPTATPAPLPTATPAHVPLTRYQGKIAFFSDRGGSVELWIMDPDGSKAFRPWHQDEAAAEYAKMREIEKHSPDGRARIEALTPHGSEAVQIVLIQPDDTNDQLTEWGRNSYDPVWSPTGNRIAFVSSQPGNDEIFLIPVSGGQPKRLTANDWEWDKHPSWSPDGTRLVFWSNRVVGRGQIWLMNDDGSGQVNLSKNKFYESDPMWIK